MLRAVTLLIRSQVLLYNGRTQQLERQITRFKDIAYSGCYRVDGRLLTAGGESGIVQVPPTGTAVANTSGVRHVMSVPRTAKALHELRGNAKQAGINRGRQHCQERFTCEQVFDVGSRAVLRQLKGHQRPVHVARFSPDKLHVLSGGDDATVRLLVLHLGACTNHACPHCRPALHSAHLSICMAVLLS